MLGGGVVQQLVPGHRGVQLSAHVTHGGNDGVQSEDKKYSFPDTESLTLSIDFSLTLNHVRQSGYGEQKAKNMQQPLIEFHTFVSRTLFLIVL